MTTEDEMAVFMYFYVDDTTGLNLSEETGLQNILKEDISVFPNPADNTIFIHSNTNLQDVIISLSDITGKMFIKDHQNFSNNTDRYLSLDVSGLPTGIYILHVIDNGNVRFDEKIIIK